MPDESEAQEAEFAARYLDERYGTRRVSVPLLPVPSPDTHRCRRRPSTAPRGRDPATRPPVPLDTPVAAPAKPARLNRTPASVPLVGTPVEQFVARIWARAHAGDKLAIRRVIADAEPAIQALVDQFSRSSGTREQRLRIARAAFQRVIDTYDPLSGRPPEPMQAIRTALERPGAAVDR